jgi:hypothetical protein
MKIDYLKKKYIIFLLIASILYFFQINKELVALKSTGITNNQILIAVLE